MTWDDFLPALQTWPVKLAEPAYTLRRVVADVITKNPVGYYLHPDTEKIAVHVTYIGDADGDRCKQAAAAVGEVAGLFLSDQDLSYPDSRWVKVAYSQTLRRTGEALNFFPGTYPGGVANHAAPLAATLTSGLLGAGLGWGAGRATQALLPRNTGKKLGRTGAVLGGLAGASPGLLWVLANLKQGRPWNDPSLLASPPTTQPSFLDTLSYKDAADILLQDSKLDSQCLTAIKHASETFGGYIPRRDPSPSDVHISSIGETLWEYGASPALTASTMGTLYAARQLPDPRSRPGWVTGGQLGQLAANAAGDYVTGLAVGAALNKIVGTPYAASTYGLGNAAVRLIAALVPRLYTN